MNRFSILLLALLSSGSLAQVRSEPAIVAFHSTQKIVKAEGFILSPGALKKVEATKITRVSPEYVHVEFDAPRDTSTMLSGWGLTDSSEVVFADVRAAEPFFYEPKACSTSVQLGPSSGGQLLSLLEIRGSRREILREQLALNMSETDTQELNNLEKLFGLEQQNRLTPETNVYELLDRLSRLEAALSRLKH